MRVLCSAPVAPARGFSAALFLLVATALGLRVSAAQAQPGEDEDRSEIIAVVGEQYVRGYATGLVEASSAALGSGLFFESGQAGDLIGPINLYVGVRAAAIPFGDGARTFNLNRRSAGQIRLPDGTLREASYTYRVEDAPTALGEHQSGPEVRVATRYRDANGDMTIEEFRFKAPQGLLGYLPVVPSGVPQAGLGVPALGLRVSARYMPPLSYQDVPVRLRNAGVNTVEGALWGVGARQSLDAWFEALPFELAIYGYYQQIGIATKGDLEQEVLDFSMVSGGVNLSKPVLEEPTYSLSLFAAAGAETSTAHFTYRAAQEDTPFSSVIDFKIENPLAFRTQAGFSTRFGPLMINLGYAPLPRNTILGGIGFSL